MATYKIKFTKAATINGKAFAAKDEVKEFTSKSSADRWIKRGHELVLDEKELARIEEEKAAKEEEAKAEAEAAAQEAEDLAELAKLEKEEAEEEADDDDIFDED